MLRITKNNLVSLDPSINLKQDISQVTHAEYVIRIRRMITEKIPIRILPPTGEPPHGYELLDIWPQNLTQTYSGAEEEIQTIKSSGLDLQFDLSRINKADLDQLATSGKNEISFYVPASWKKLQIPCKVKSVEEINDPDADELQIAFLRKQVFPIDTSIPIRVYYPIEFLTKINPDTFPLELNEQIKIKDGVTVFTPKLFIHDVTQEFLSVIRNHLEIVVVAAPKNKRELLEWNVQVVSPHEVEEHFIESMLRTHPKSKSLQPEHKDLLRKRFHEYMDKLELYISPEQPLVLEASLEIGKISVH